MINHCKENLLQLKKLIRTIGDQDYSRQLDVLNGSTVGQHIRHILEFYICLIKCSDYGYICYDERERDLLLETERQFSILTIDRICNDLEILTPDLILDLRADFTSWQEEKISMRTSVQRELAYCLEHSIHHQAIIKIGLNEVTCENLVDSSFGVAPSTIKYRLEIEKSS